MGYHMLMCLIKFDEFTCRALAPLLYVLNFNGIIRIQQIKLQK